MKKWIKITASSIGILLGLPALFFILVTAAEYRPKESLPLSPLLPARIPQFEETGPGGLQILSWNIDSSTALTSRSQNVIDKNLAAVLNTIDGTQADLYFLQNTDLRASRTNKNNQVLRLLENLPEYMGYYSPIHRTLFARQAGSSFPGSINSGLFTLSRPLPTEVVRLNLPTPSPWPKSCFQPKYGALVTHLPAATPQKNWVLINLQLGSSNEDLTNRNDQLDKLGRFVKRLYAEGHYILIGGDWGTHPGALPKSWMPQEWTWAFNNEIPTKKTPSSTPKPEESITGAFLISPNLSLDEVKTLSLDFQNADHNPVEITVSIRS